MLLLTTLEFPLNCPLYVRGDGFAFFLSKSGEDGEHQFAVSRKEVNVLLLKPDTDAQLLQMPDNA